MEEAITAIIAFLILGALVLFFGLLALPFLIVGAPIAYYLYTKNHSPKAVEREEQERTQQFYEAVSDIKPPDRLDFIEWFGSYVPVEDVCDVAIELYDNEAFDRPDPPPRTASSLELARYRDQLARYGARSKDAVERFKKTTLYALHHAYDPRTKGEFDVTSPLTNKDLADMLPAFYQHDDLYKSLRTRLDENLERNGGILPQDGTKDPKTYIAGTPLAKLQKHAKFSLTGMDHKHLVAGTGHGKTQTLQYLISRNLKEKCSIVVIDSQNQLINNIAQLNIPTERLVWIDPTDIEYPPALNLFDVGMDRINKYTPLEKERTLNQIIELYDFVLGALLGDELTAKQAVVFRYITRLMLNIEGATIHTLLDIMKPQATQKYRQEIARLPATARSFFENEFDNRQFNETKEQVLRRLYGILENATFDRMMSHPRNRLDMFEAMNSGKIIIINTAQDFLMQQGTRIFGRFMIAMIRQSVQERATIKNPVPCYVYIDEFADYLTGTGEESVEAMLTQARKQNVSITLSHQYIGQLTPKLQQAIASNTGTKLAGGVSPSDARLLAPMLRTTDDFIMSQKRGQFATFSKGQTDEAVSLSIPFGVLEKLPKTKDIKAVRQYMRDHYGAVQDQEAKKKADIEWILSQISPYKEPTEPEKPSTKAKPVAKKQPSDDNEPKPW